MTVPGPNIVASFLGTGVLTRQTLYLNLFTNDVTIAAGTVAGSLTVASGGGYAQKTLTGDSWTGTSVGGTCTITAPEQTFAFTGTVGNVYGWALTTGSGLTGNLVTAQRFPEEQMIGGDGDSIAMTPTLVGDTQVTGGSVEKQSQTTGTDTSGAFDSANRVYVGTDFVAASSYTLTRFDLYLLRIGSPTGNITAYIYSNSGGAPNTLLGTSTNTIDASTISDASPEWITWNFSGVSLSNGTVYWIEITKSAGDDSNYIGDYLGYTTFSGRTVKWGTDATLGVSSYDNSQLNHRIYGY